MNFNNKFTNCSDSDSDDYVDLSLNLELEKELYQFVTHDDKLNLKCIGLSSIVPDVIIKENFGPNSNMSLYSCIYSISELQQNLNTLFYPLIKLIIKKNTNNIIISFAIKLLKQIDINNLINEWELYLIVNNSIEKDIQISKIEKNINPTNIISKLIEYSLDIK
jgi:hypothetical protein